jgi:hypothetical protein
VINGALKPHGGSRRDPDRPRRVRYALRRSGTGAVDWCLVLAAFEPTDPGVERRLLEASIAAEPNMGNAASARLTQSVFIPRRSATSSAVSSRSVWLSSQTPSRRARYGIRYEVPRFRGSIARIVQSR